MSKIYVMGLGRNKQRKMCKNGGWRTVQVQLYDREIVAHGGDWRDLEMDADLEIGTSDGEKYPR